MSYYDHRPSAFNILPPVVKNLIIINVLFFLAKKLFMFKFGYDLNDSLGMHLPGSDSFHIYQIFTYMFMHGDEMHIFFNMFGVWMFGSALENAWGAKKFLIYYLLTGIGAAFIHYLVLYFVDLLPILNKVDGLLAEPYVKNYEELINYRYQLLNAPNVVGASGSLYGLLLGFGMLFPNSLVFLYFFPVRAKYLVIIYGGMELINGLSSASSNIAHFAHLGGMLIGYILIKMWGKYNFRQY